MRRSVLPVCLLLGVALFTVGAGGREEPCQDHTTFLQEAILSVARIHPGSTRAEVEEEFTMDGGMQFVVPSRYVLKKCPYIKVDIEFKASDGGKLQFDESSGKHSPSDLVVKVGRPYLEYPDKD